MKGVLLKYKDLLPITDKTPLISLHEGDTPLIFAQNLSKDYKINIWLKYEGMNPTGSFKDRGMVVAMAKALEEGSKAVICASTGNTAASAAAYSAFTRLKAFVVLPENAIALGKLAQAIMYGAKVISVRGNFDDALNLVREASKRLPITLVNSVNPYRLEGQKTAAFEVCDTLGKAPENLAIPVGNAGNITAYWMGFKEYFKLGKVDRTPKMLGFQAEGAAPLVKGHPIPDPKTIATAIKIGNPASGEKALNAVKESNGLIDTVTDEEIIEAQKELASEEGIFAEPASAASWAGVKKLLSEKRFPGTEVVCILTGNGLKDPDIAIKQSKISITIDLKIEELEKVLDL
ncbi:MAG TPA: threonine synthase [Dictyoglomaceae bacterium]|nr:threonine synthase [Dictyoglomaceae bacterium]HOL38966.1 threonine synthase [Dictyoglomaceae bacterium]HOP94846.1 threonine synthase [Dictyoglomaceae bacterium]HPP15617.1 threonine synthase [Dictyoglomaceae bacterium]HPU43516.1 threonine synthase [Dictyoglomaceae bacterium]